MTQGDIFKLWADCIPIAMRCCVHLHLALFLIWGVCLDTDHILMQSLKGADVHSTFSPGG